MTNQIDIDQAEADAAEVSETADTMHLTQLGCMALEFERKIAMLDAELKGAKKALDQIMVRDIPKALAEAGTKGFVFEHEGGTATIVNEMKVKGSLNGAPDIEAALAYLEETGLPGGVKATMSIDFAEDEVDLAADLQSQIASQGKDPIITRTINPQTLMAFARQALKDDPNWDYEKVGLRAWPQSKFTTR